MKPSLVLSLLMFLSTAVLCLAQGGAPSTSHTPAATPSTAHSSPQEPASSAAQKPSSEGDLDTVLTKMNAAAGEFRSAQADFEFETYQKVVDEKDTQKGRIYFRRKGKNVDAAFNITTPATKQVVYKDGKVSIYEPRIDQLTVREVGKNKADVEAFLSLGFGASGDDLRRDYDVKMSGWETVDGVKTVKLELVPKSEKMKQTYSNIILWIDPERDVLLKQQFIERSGDYRLAHYTHMKLNGKISDDEFRIKTTGSTKTIRPQ
ncbi:MAG: outer membrane lipoprotein-sorting protein [Candidatus Angelobacter sp.]